MQEETKEVIIEKAAQPNFSQILPKKFLTKIKSNNFCVAQAVLQDILYGYPKASYMRLSIILKCTRIGHERG